MISLFVLVILVLTALRLLMWSCTLITLPGICFKWILACCLVLLISAIFVNILIPVEIYRIHVEYSDGISYVLYLCGLAIIDFVVVSWYETCFKHSKFLDLINIGKCVS